MAILYTQAQVNNAQLRAQVAMYIISQNIENGFYYLGSPVYQTYKTLQYSIYVLFNIIGNEEQFVTFNPNPTPYEYSFYELVGSLINKTKQFDVYGLFGGNTNPNYQPPNGTIINVINQGSIVNETIIPFTAQTTIELAYYNTTYAQRFGSTPLVCQIYVDNGSDPAYPDTETAPAILHVINGDPSSGLLSITWTYPEITTGYILLSGVENS